MFDRFGNISTALMHRAKLIIEQMIQAVRLRSAREHFGGGEPRKSFGPILDHSLRNAAVKFQNERQLELGPCLLQQRESFLGLLPGDMNAREIVIERFEFRIQLQRSL